MALLVMISAAAIVAVIYGGLYAAIRREEKGEKD